MPMYEYSCRAHGTFEALRSMQARAAPAPCPRCKARSPRVLSAPRLSVLAPAARAAFERNERSRHEPRVATAPDAGKDKVRSKPHRHRGRPWAIEHG